MFHQGSFNHSQTIEITKRLWIYEKKIVAFFWSKKRAFHQLLMEIYKNSYFLWALANIIDHFINDIATS